MKLKKNQTLLIAALAVAAAAIFFYLISLYRYFNLQLFHYDLGYFARVIWLMSRFKPPVINHVSFGRINFLGDHFSPSLVLFSPLMWIWPDVRVLLLQQAVSISLSGLVLFLIARKKLGVLSSSAVSGTYLIFTGTLAPLISDWHPEPTAALVLFLIFYSLIYSKKSWLSLILILVFLGFKESNALTLIIMLLAVYAAQPKIRKQLIYFVILAGGWFLAATQLIIPSIGGKYHYAPELPKNLSELRSSLTKNPEKLRLVKNAFMSFGFLPLLSFPWVGACLAELGMRLVPVSSIFSNFTLEMHYNSSLAVFLSLGTVDVLSKAECCFKKKLIPIVLSMWLLLLALFSARKLRSPINFLINPVFYQTFKSNRDGFEKLKNYVPKTGSLMAQNNLLPYFLDQEGQLFLLEYSYQDNQPDWILLSVQEDQNINNFYGPSGLTGSDFTKIIKADLDEDECYSKEKKVDVYYLYNRIKECQ